MHSIFGSFLISLYFRMQVTDQDLLVNTIIDTGSIFRMDAGD